MPAHPRIQRYNDLGAADQASLCDPSLAFTHPRLHDLAALYAQVRGSRAMPSRTDFSARMLAPHLRNMTFVDRVVEPGRPRRYRFRYFGSGMAQHSADHTKKNHNKNKTKPKHTNWNESWDMPLELGLPLRFVSRFRSLDLEYIAVESLTAPLCDAQGNPCGLLVSSETAPAVAKAG